MRNDCFSGFLRNVQGCFDYCLSLHLGDFRVGNGKTAATVPHHRVKFVQTFNNILQFLNGYGQLFS